MTLGLASKPEYEVADHHEAAGFPRVWWCLGPRSGFFIGESPQPVASIEEWAVDF